MDLSGYTVLNGVWIYQGILYCTDIVVYSRSVLSNIAVWIYQGILYCTDIVVYCKRVLSDKAV